MVVWAAADPDAGRACIATHEEGNGELMPTIKNPTKRQKEIIAEAEAGLKTGRELTGQDAARWRRKTTELIGERGDGSVVPEED